MCPTDADNKQGVSFPGFHAVLWLASRAWLADGSEESCPVNSKQNRHMKNPRLG